MPVDDLCFDVGMHLGEDSAYYLAKGFRVVAFEANPALVARARQRFAGALASGTLTIVAGAIAPPGTRSLEFFTHGQTEWGTTDPAWVTRNASGGASEATTVPTVDFLACLQEYGVPYYMKVDIEGSDRLCFEALASFEDRPAYVSLESDKASLGAVRDEFAMLSRLGYDRFAVVQQRRMDRRTVSTRTLRGEPLDYRFELHSSGAFGPDLARWETAEHALARYRRVFPLYRWLGDGSFVNEAPLLGRIRNLLSNVTGVGLPGWYDTHARHVSARRTDLP